MSSDLKDARFNYAAVRLFALTGSEWGDVSYEVHTAHLEAAQAFLERNPQAIGDWASEEATERAFG